MNRKKTSQSDSSFDQARNDLFSHIHRCGVLRAEEQQQNEWMNDTVEYLGECYPGLSDEQVEELKAIGLRFCRPVIAHGAENTAVAEDADGAEEPATAEASAA